MTYKVGSGKLSETLPDIVQKPDCGLNFQLLPEYQIIEDSTNEKVRAAVTIDTENAAIDIETSDFSLIDQKVYLTIYAGSDQAVDRAELSLEINFDAMPPEFDLEGAPENSALTCSWEDANWVFYLPSIQNDDVQETSIKMLTESEFFTFDEDSRAVFISDIKRNAVLRGIECPNNAGSIELTFLIVSDKLGKNEQTLSFQVNPIENEQKSTSQYHININTEETVKDDLAGESQQILKLDISGIEISALGKM